MRRGNCRPESDIEMAQAQHNKAGDMKDAAARAGIKC